MTLRDRRTAWLVTRYEDVARVLKDDTFAKDKLNAMDPEQRAKTPWVPGFLKPLERNMLDLDDPDHVRLRALVSKAFTPALSNGCGGGSRRSAKNSSTPWNAKGREGDELVAGYALPLPATVIAELLGVPAEDHQVPPVVEQVGFGLLGPRHVAGPPRRAFVRALPPQARRAASRRPPRTISSRRWSGRRRRAIN